MPIEAPPAEHDEPVEVVSAARLVVVEQLDELRMERDVAVVVEFADRHAQPVPAVHEHDSVGGEFAELADAKSGAGEHLDHQPPDRIGICGGAHQLGGVGVGQEFGERSSGVGRSPLKISTRVGASG